MSRQARFLGMILLVFVVLGIPACVGPDSSTVSSDPDLEAVWGSSEQPAKAVPASRTAQHDAR